MVQKLKNVIFFRSFYQVAVTFKQKNQRIMASKKAFMWEVQFILRLELTYPNVSKSDHKYKIYVNLKIAMT